MSLFIHPDNQTLLWQMLHRSPLISQVFPPGSPSIGRKDDWFKRVISAVHASLPLHISKDDLYTINKETLRSMLNELKQKVEPSTSTTSSQQKNMEPVYSRNGLKQETYNDNFSSRQKEYETMFAKPVAPDVNFSDNIKDEVITGEAMEDLIERHRKERELEVKMFAPPISPFLPDAQNTQNKESTPKTMAPLEPSYNQRRLNLKVSNESVELESENISLELIESPNDDYIGRQIIREDKERQIIREDKERQIIREDKERQIIREDKVKQVAWEDQVKISDLENKVENLTKRIEEMFSMFLQSKENEKKTENINIAEPKNINVENLKTIMLEAAETV